MPFLQICIEFFCEAIKAGISLRGCISTGMATMNQHDSIYFGRPLVEAARGETAQSCIGMAFGRSFNARSLCGFSLPTATRSAGLAVGVPPCGRLFPSLRQYRFHHFFSNEGPLSGCPSFFHAEGAEERTPPKFPIYVSKRPTKGQISPYLNRPLLFLKEK